MEYQIQKPLNESKSILAKVRTGSPRTMKSYEINIRKLIKDLYHLKHPINSITEVNLSHINVLISHWKNLNLSIGTINNRITILRKYLKSSGNTLYVPANDELGLSRRIRSTTPCRVPKNIIERVQHNITRLIIGLQIYLGLTKSESVRFKIQLYGEDSRFAYIQKKISHNNNDRMISIDNENQINLIQELEKELNGKLSLEEIADYRIIVNLYNAELNLLQCSSKTPFRAVYAKNKFSQLTELENLSEKKAINTISNEMGVPNKKTIKQWISHE